MFNNRTKDKMKELSELYSDGDNISYYQHPSNEGVCFMKIHIKGFMNGGYVDENNWYMIDTKGNEKEFVMPRNMRGAFFNELKKIKYEG